MESQGDVASGYGKIIALLSAARVVPLRMRLRVAAAAAAAAASLQLSFYMPDLIILVLMIS